MPQVTFTTAELSRLLADAAEQGAAKAVEALALTLQARTPVRGENSGNGGRRVEDRGNNGEGFRLGEIQACFSG